MQLITAIVETPKGSAQKYNYDAENKWFRLKKTLPAGMVFPFDFGFIPDTRGGDGDPLDIIIISEFKTFPGCVMDCRIIGAVAAEQTEKGKTVRNDRLFAIPEASQFFADVKSIGDLPKDIVDEIEKFFVNYNRLEGKEFKPVKRLNASQAMNLIKQK